MANRAGFWRVHGIVLWLLPVVLAGHAVVRAQDSDADGVLDGADNCVNVFNTAQIDGDLDTAGNSCDCNPDESGTSTLLGPGVNLSFGSASDLSWDAPVDTGGGGLVYDLLRGGVASNLNAGTCIESDGADTIASDGTAPDPGEVFFYAVRAQAGCGGNLGTRTLETRRAGAACPAVGALGTCAENMDSSCPNVGPACGATFDGGVDCLREFIGNCYDTGAFSYKVTQAAPLTIDLSGGVHSLELFFAHEDAGTSGTMRFFDADNLEVGPPLASNGPCQAATMPARRNISFYRAVRRVEVTATGVSDVWIDSFTVNANAAATCTETMDATCPNNSPACTDVAFSGGLGCLVEGLGNCYSTGVFAYKVVDGSPVEIDFAADVNSIELFFAAEVATVSGSMRFLDRDGLEVDSPLSTNGVCGGVIMPPTQALSFSRPVRKIEVSASGVGDVWIDTLTVNP